MARTSKKKQAPVPVKKDKIYSVGIYARLSVDGTDRKNESIDNQLELCREYVRSHEDMEIFDCYSDLGKTGTNFQRDDFERLMADVRMRKVDCIVVKDLSRFGRNHLEMGNYLGKIFPFLGVRFIAVNDNFDNMDGDPETLGVQLKNLVNELYAKDIAVKIRSSRVKQFERGSFSGCHPVYGYDVVKEGNRRVLVINEEAAAAEAEALRKKCLNAEKAIDKAKAQRMAEFEAYALGQKESYDTSIDEVEALRKNHEKLMVQLSEAEDMVGELNRMKVHESFAVTKLTEELLDEYVESIEVHPGNEVRIKWK